MVKKSCHIPEFARVNPTKMSWDWSNAGRKKDGKPYQEEGPLGRHSYDTMKGDFVWGKNVKPAYYWYNGSMEHLTVKDTIDPGRPVALNRPLGSRDDSLSRIFPFKVHTGKQPYDKVNKNMTIPHLFPKGKEDTAAYWKGYDWGKAIEYGMTYAGLEFSGEYDFVETTYVFPITHMVAPKEKALACTECHSKDNSRLASLAGFYMPARDCVGVIETLGWILVIGSLVGVIVHGLGRIFASGGSKEED